MKLLHVGAFHYNVITNGEIFEIQYFRNADESHS